MSASRKSIGVVITTVADWANCTRLLTSLVVSSEPPDDIVIVNNSSSTPLQRELAQAPVRVRAIEAGAGLNVAFARDIGWRELSTDICVFVDDDNVFEAATIAHLRRAFSDPGTWAAAPVAILGTSDLIWCAGVERGRWLGHTRFLCAGRLREDADIPQNSLEFPNCFAVRREALEALHGFDHARFPMHFSEAEFFKRFRLAGFGAVHVVGTSAVRHLQRNAPQTGQGEMLRVALHGGSQRLRDTAAARVRFFRLYAKQPERLTLLGLGVPGWLLAVALRTFGSEGDLRLKLRVVGSLVRGTVDGFARLTPSSPVRTRA